ncbi:MAG: carbohydrate ABC transporter permease [Lachnospiraceae bacterium]|nr:carbohydrate ABC transporter permease [Lachnospiraceae bacterium]
MSRKTKKKLERIILYVLVVLIVAVVLGPFIWMFLCSISTKADLISKPYHWWPANPTLKNYMDIFFGTGNTTTDAANQFMAAFRNSLMIALICTAVSVLIGLLASFAFSRFRFRGRTLMLNTVLFMQMIPPIALIIPMYMIMLRLKLMDNKWALIIIYLSFTLPFVTWIVKGYIDGIPTDLEDAAMIDGCGRLQAFFKVVLPISASGLAATTIFAFIIAWNEFFYALNFTSTLRSKTLPVLITEFSSKFGNDFILTSTAGVLTSLPPVLIALIFQKYIISGLSSGAVKG